MNSRSSQNVLFQVFRYAVLILLAFLFLLPFYIIMRNALMTDAEITSPHWKWLPALVHKDGSSGTLGRSVRENRKPEKPENVVDAPQKPKTLLGLNTSSFSEVFSDPEKHMWSSLRNSLFIATTTLIFQMLFSSMAGYALARIPARGRNVVFYVIVATLMIPGAVTFVPSYAVMAWLGGINTRWGIIAPGLVSAFSIFLFRQFYLRFPTEIEEAGRIDGLSYFGVYWKLLLPNSTSILMALGVLTFIGSWNSFVWPLIIGQDASTWTVQVVLSTFLTAQTINLSQLFAAAFVGVAPLVIVFLLMQRYIVEGAKFSSGKE